MVFTIRYEIKIYTDFGKRRFKTAFLQTRVSHGLNCFQGQYLPPHLRDRTPALCFKLNLVLGIGDNISILVDHPNCHKRKVHIGTTKKVSKPATIFLLQLSVSLLIIVYYFAVQPMKIISFPFKSNLLLACMLTAGRSIMAQSNQHPLPAARDFPPETFAQRLFKQKTGNTLFVRLYNRFWANDTARTIAQVHKSSWLALPVVSYSPETRLNFRAVGIYSFYTTRNDPVERNSGIYGTLGYSQNHQSKFELKSTIWTKENKFHIVSAFIYQHTVLKYYGTGNQARLTNESLQQASLTRLDLEAERLVFKDFYAGPEFMYFNTAINGTFISQSIRAAGHASSLGANLIYDSRDNQNFTTRGSYLNFNPQFAPKGFSSTGAINQYNFDLRHFVNLGPGQVLAFNSVAQFESGPSIPFYFLNQLGNDQIMRGYYQGRFREKNLAAAQVEYRYLFFPRFGVAVFAGGGEVFNHAFSAPALKPNYGFGGRYVFDTRSRITIRLDYGAGEKPAGEKRISGFYLALGEAF